jgi:biotin synthase
VGWRISLAVEDLLRKGEHLEGLNAEEAVILLSQDLHSKEVYALMETANRISRAGFGEKGENHLHIGLNASPCPFNCRFCSLADNVRIFTDPLEFPMSKIVEWAKLGERNHADALNIMTTGTYPFEKLLEIGRVLKKQVNTPLVANTRDINHKEGEALLAAGFEGAYHAVRLGEGRDTPFDAGKRIRTISVLKDVGLLWMNCVEPVGPEHDLKEIAERMVLARTYGATYSGVMRRINFPGSPLAHHGMISEREMARMVAVSRLVMGDAAKAHCTHEPHAASLMAGANLFFPEVGSSPRDREANTGKGRGQDIVGCKKLQLEMGWNPDLPSNCFGFKDASQGETPCMA